MRFSTVLGSALALGATFVAASDVIDLTGESFKSSVDAEELMLVEFFAPWCGHCKALAPEYEEAATTLKNQSIKLAKVDCTAHADLCQEHGVGGYPTLKVFRYGKDKEYGGPRKADGIISYMKKQSLPALSAVTADNHSQFIKDDKVVLVAYVDKEDDALLKAVTDAANDHRDDFLFGSTTDAAAIKEAGVTPPAFVLYKTFDEGRVDLPAADVKSASAESLIAFVKENAVPLLDEISGENYPTYAQSGLPLAYLFLDPTDSKKDAVIAEMTPVAKKFKGKLNIVWIDAVKYAQHAQSLNLPDAKWPAFVIDDMPQSLKYPLDQSSDPTAASVTAQITDFLAGKLLPKLKTDPVLENQTEAVYSMVGSEFEKTIFENDKDVFAEFYAPWCGHCKRLAPIWEQLAELYKSQNDKFSVVKMDSTSNDLPPSAGFKISGFPTLKFKPAGSKTFIDYEGDRSLASLIEFVQTNSKNKLTQPEVVEPSSAEAAPEATPAATPEAEPVAAHEHEEL